MSAEASSFSSTATTLHSSFSNSSGPSAATLTGIRCHLRQSSLEQDAVRVISTMVNMMEAISKRLLTGSHILRESFRREIEELATDIMRGSDRIRAHLAARLGMCEEIYRDLLPQFGAVEMHDQAACSAWHLTLQYVLLIHLLRIPSLLLMLLAGNYMNQQASSCDCSTTLPAITTPPSTTLCFSFTVLSQSTTPGSSLHCSGRSPCLL